MVPAGCANMSEHEIGDFKREIIEIKKKRKSMFLVATGYHSVALSIYIYVYICVYIYYMHLYLLYYYSFSLCHVWDSVCVV